MANGRARSRKRMFRLNVAAVAALLAAIALVVYAASSSRDAHARLSAPSAGKLRLSLTLSERRQLFAAVITEHESGLDGRGACEIVAARSDLDEEAVRRIVREGVSRGWPRE